MKSRTSIFISVSFLIISTFCSCKKGILDSLFKNDSFIECKINGKYAKGEGLRRAFSAPSEFHMNYSYYEDDTFTFNIAKAVNDKDGGNYKIYISFVQKSLPEIGERYYFEEQVDNDTVVEFIDKYYVASIGVKPYFYQCADTLTLPETIRKNRIVLRTDIIKSGYIEFTTIDIEKGDICGIFNFEAEGTSKRVPQASYKASVTEGKFEGYHIERDRTYYNGGLYDIIF